MRSAHHRRRRGLPAAVVALAVVLGLAAPTGAGAAVAPGDAPGDAKGSATRDVLYVGNNWDGTADVIDPVSFRRLTRLNIVPDKRERETEIALNPVSLSYYFLIRQLVGEGHDQFVDDMFSSPDGRFLYVSRPSFADVVAIDLRTRAIVWRFKVDGNRADHMAISPDGRRVVVSASTAGVVHVIDTRTGREAGRFESGDQPHENNYSADGRRIFHASIGTVYTPTDDVSQDATKGERVFMIVDARTLRVIKRVDMGKKLLAFGVGGMSSAVRPMALSPDERFVYFQLSFFHGFVEYDLKRDAPTRMVILPLRGDSVRLRRQDYLLDSAHHGLTMNPSGTQLCAAGTMSDYAALVRRDTLRFRIVNVGHKPYWSTNSGDGRYCFVSVSGDDRVSVISYARQREIARIPVGDHPQRMRMGTIQRSYVSAGDPYNDSPPPRDPAGSGGGGGSGSGGGTTGGGFTGAAGD